MPRRPSFVVPRFERGNCPGGAGFQALTFFGKTVLPGASHDIPGHALSVTPQLDRGDGPGIGANPQALEGSSSPTFPKDESGPLLLAPARHSPCSVSDWSDTQSCRAFCPPGTISEARRPAVQWHTQTLSDGRDLGCKPVSITTPFEDSGSCHPARMATSQMMSTATGFGRL